MNKITIPPSDTTMFTSHIEADLDLYLGHKVKAFSNPINVIRRAQVESCLPAS